MSGVPRIGAAVVVCLGACAAARPAVGVGFDPEGMLIGRVVILDNRAQDDAAITSRLATREKRSVGFPKVRFDPLSFQLDQRRVVAFYRERGYFEAEVVATGFVKDAFGDLLVWLRVREGPPTRVTTVSLRGAPEIRGLDEHSLLGRADVRIGAVFDHPGYLGAKRKVQGALVEAGYAHARVDGVVRVDRDAHTAAIELHVDPGPLVRIGRTRVETVPSMAAAVAARAAWRQGEVFDPVRIERTKQRLRAMGLFAGVRVEYPRDDRPPVIDMTIHASPALRNEAKAGGGAEGVFALRSQSSGTLPFYLDLDRTRFELRARGSYARKRWPWTLSLFRVDAKLGVLPLPTEDFDFDRFFYEVRATVERWDLGAARTHWTFGGAIDRKIFEAYTIWGPRLLGGVEYPAYFDRLFLSGRVQLAPELDLEANDAVLAAGLGVDNPVRLAIVEQSVTWDDRDKPLDAHRGVYAQLALEEGAAPLYVKATGEARAYWPRTKRLVTAWRAHAGVLRGLEDGGETPITQRFYSGGADSHRGFGYRRLSPRLPDAGGELVPVGGAAFVETGVELRADISGRWGGALFLDGGDVTAAAEDLSLSNLHWAAGFGLRFDTELGPFRGDLGVRLNRMGPGEPDAGDGFFDRVVGHVSFGEAF